MPFWWLALVFVLFVLTTGLVVLTVRTLSFFRGLRRLRRELVAGQEQIVRASAEVERRLEALTERSARLESSLDRLGESFERAAVLAGAARDVRAAAGRLRSVVPRK